MQVIDFADTNTSGFVDANKGHFIEGFLIGSKKNKNGWTIPKQVLTKEKVTKEFKNKPFIIIPEKIAHGIDAHYHGKDKYDTMNGYQNYAHGTINEILGPFPYEDNPDEIYYTHITKLNDSKSASVLTELGANTKIPFAVSPHIWDETNDHVFYQENIVTDFTGIGIALVDDGAYGDIAIVNNMCTGSRNECHKSLGAANHSCRCCLNTDDNIAKILSSHFSKSASTQISMSDNNSNTSNNNTNTNTAAGTSTQTTPTSESTGQLYKVSNPTVNPQNTLTNEPKKDDNQVIVTKEEYDKINKELADNQKWKKEFEKIRDERNTEKITKVFGDYIKEEKDLTEIVSKHRDNADYVVELFNEFSKHIGPKLIEQGKQEAQKEIDAKIAQENNNPRKSKGAANNAILRPEPKKIETTAENEQDKAASVTNTNEVALLRKYLGYT